MRKPCAEHTPLLELMQEKGRAAWRQVSYTSEAQKITQWYKLTNPNYDGCESQREFVVKALATPDFAILEGPPGSGKTTTILEIIAQMVMRGQKVMLAASTNAAIDNILERLTDLPQEVQDKILAVRLGTDGAVSESVQNYTLFDIKDKDIKNEIISRANLVCGTIIGVLQHPEFELNNANKPVVPIFDCLIVDEASKTTFQEFLVPAIFAKKWILSGDLRQLTPYIEQESIESSLAQIPEFNESAQQAQSILMALENGVFGGFLLL
jgi:superfamily I DNA and/or RNA helicase